MAADLLQQLRDIHVPAPPDPWPPAPGWWLLAALAIALLVWSLRALGRARAARRPIREARRLHTALAARLRAGTIDARAYTDGCNEILKRLFVHGLGRTAAGPLADERWLALLDRALGEPAFTGGAGQALGAARFTRHPEIDAAALVPLVERLLMRITPAHRTLEP